MNAKFKMRQYVIFSTPRKFDTADIKCFTVVMPRKRPVNGDIKCESFTLTLLHL